MRRTALIRAVDRTLAGPGAPGAGDGVVVGVSGGADSTALLDAMVFLAPGCGLRVVAAHFDHGLRPGSEEDAASCAALAARLGVPFFSERQDIEARARERRRGIEETARHFRYAFLRRVRAETRSCVIVVGHTRDDQVETLLLRLMRGSGGRGLAAMRLRRSDIFRPLLDVPREIVLEHLRLRGLGFREDPSNGDRRFARNRVRHELLPYLEEHFNPRLREALGRTARLLGDETRLVEALGRRAGPSVERRDGGAVVSAEALRRARPALARLALRRALSATGGLRGVGVVHIEKLLDLARSRTASGRRLCLPGNREAVFRFGQLLVRPSVPRAPGFSFALDVPGEVGVPGGLLMRATCVSGPSAPPANDATVIRVEPGTGLTVRSRQAGDWLRSGGKAVSLKRFLLERRVPADVRGALPLVARGPEVLWVPGWPAASSDTGPYVRLELVRVT